MSRLRRGLRRRVMVVVATVVFTAATAQAGTTITTGSTTLGNAKGLVYRLATSENVTVPNSGGAAAECEAGNGKRTTGGGAGIPGEATDPVSDAAPIAGYSTSRFWVGTFTAHHVTKTIRAYVICGDPAGRKVKQRTTEDASAGTGITLKATCPRDMRVSGGGISFTSDDSQWSDSAPYDSGRDPDEKPDDGWKVTAYPLGMTDVTAVAVCIRGMSLKYRTQTIDGLQNTAVQGQASCHSDEAVTGGGGRVSGPASAAYAAGTEPYDVGPPNGVPDDMWAFYVFIEAGPERSVTTVAICKS